MLATCVVASLLCVPAPSEVESVPAANDLADEPVAAPMAGRSDGDAPDPTPTEAKADPSTPADSGSDGAASGAQRGIGQSPERDRPAEPCVAHHERQRRQGRNPASRWTLGHAVHVRRTRADERGRDR